MDNPTIDLIYQRPKLQVQPNNKDELIGQKHNTNWKIHTHLFQSM